jgi:hypothetical protein
MLIFSLYLGEFSQEQINPTRAQAKTAILAILRVGIIANVAIHHWAISALNNSNSSFSLNLLSTLLVQGQIKPVL